MGKCLYPRKGSVHTAPVNLPPVGTALNAMTWEQVRKISDMGLAAAYFAVGDTKSIVINGTVGATEISEATLDVYVLGINHNASLEGSNRIHFGFGKKNGKNVGFFDGKYGNSPKQSGYFIMNIEDTNVGGWASCHMRKTMLGSDSTPTSPTANTLLAALPADLRAVMKPITKYTDNTGGGTNVASNVTATEEYLPLLSPAEVVVSTNPIANTSEQNYQVQYDYYKAGNSTVHYRYKNVSNVLSVFLRSPYRHNTTGFCILQTTGSSAYYNAYLSNGASPLFCV